MQGLTPEGRKLVEEAAARHGFGSEAGLQLFEALALGNGTQAQFNHPELGGMGQWSQGGMIMIGDMFNNALKQRVSALCDDLSSLLRGQDVFTRRPIAASAGPWNGPSYNVSGATVSLFAQGFGRDWWPAGLGSPSASGGQNDLQYAYFPQARRLAVKTGSTVRVYDSGDNQISGVSQQQGFGQSLTFTSQNGVIDLASLPLVEDSGAPAVAASPAPASSSQPAPAPASGAMPADSGDVFATIEKLAALREKKIISDDEFAAKKAELLARL